MIHHLSKQYTAHDSQVAISSYTIGMIHFAINWKPAILTSIKQMPIIFLKHGITSSKLSMPAKILTTYVEVDTNQNSFYWVNIKTGLTLCFIKIYVLTWNVLPSTGYHTNIQKSVHKQLAILMVIFRPYQ
jgi:hypothetical protein